MNLLPSFFAAIVLCLAPKALPSTAAEVVTAPAAEAAAVPAAATPAAAVPAACSQS